MLLLLLLLLSLPFFDTFRMDGGFGFRDWATTILRLWLAGVSTCVETFARDARVLRLSFQQFTKLKFTLV